MGDIVTVMFLGAWALLAVVLLVGATRARDRPADTAGVRDDGGGRPGKRLS